MSKFLSTLAFVNEKYSYYDLNQAVTSYGRDIQELPYTIRILLESLLRKYDNNNVSKHHIENLVTFPQSIPKERCLLNRVESFYRTLQEFQ